MMRSLIVGALVAMTALGVGPASAGQQDFKLVNRTGYQIDEVYVSRSSSRNWGEDIMGKDALAAGGSVQISFDAPENICQWDLHVKYNDGDEATWNHLNLCQVETVTLFWDRKNQTTRAVTE